MIPLILWAGIASAADPTDPGVGRMDAQIFRPAIDARSMFEVDESGRYDRTKPLFRALLGYAYKPLVGESTDGDSVVVLRNLANLDLIGGYDFGPARLSMRLPLLYADGDGGSGAGLGDLEFDLRGTLLSRAKWPVGLAVAASIAAPTGTVHNLPVSSPGAQWSARMILDGEAGPVLLAMNLGVQGQPLSSLTNVSWGTQLLARGGATFAVHPKVDVTAEAAASIDVSRGVSRDSSPVEGGVGSSFHTGKGVAVRVGLFAGMTPGLGDPAVRALFGIDYDMHVARDTDGDGITDDHDACITVAEDMDGFQDDDGCPEQAHIGVRFVDESHHVIEDVQANVDGAGGHPGWDVDPGEHHLHASAPGFEPLDETMSVPVQGLPDVERMLKAIPVIGMGVVTLHVHTAEGAPIDAHWTIENEQGTATGGAASIPVVQGHHFLSVEGQGYGGSRLAIDVVHDQAIVVDVVLAPPHVVVKDDFIELKGTVYFATNTATLEDRGLPLLRELAETLVGHPELLKIRIEGHTDDRGAAAYNLALSDARAKAVRDFLVSQGVAVERLDCVGFGESRPLDPGTGEVAWSVNRRVEIRILDRAPAAH